MKPGINAVFVFLSKDKIGYRLFELGFRRNGIVKSCDSGRSCLILDRFITLESKNLTEICSHLQPKRFLQQAKTCLNRTISRSHYDLMDPRHNHYIWSILKRHVRF